MAHPTFTTGGIFKGAEVMHIHATAGIVGTMLASDPALATLPVSVMVCGIWLGTVPQGYLARNSGRRFALQAGSVVGTLASFDVLFRKPLATLRSQ